MVGALHDYAAVPSFRDVSGTVWPEEVMGTRSGLELEIGFGRGRFIRERAKNTPSVRILGIETKRKLVYLCTQKAAEQGLSNILAMHGDAREVISRMQPDACFDNIFVLFPDPWWKARHQKRMVVTDAMTEQVVRLLVPGGHFFVQTDVAFRAEAYQRILLAQRGLSPLGSDGFVDDNPFGARTSREYRAMELGLPVYRLLFVKQQVSR